MPDHKLISLSDAVRRFARDGMIYASGAALPIGSDAIVFGKPLSAMPGGCKNKVKSAVRPLSD